MIDNCYWNQGIVSMKSLFGEFKNTTELPLRIYEPLIRYDADDNPKPRQLINSSKVSELTQRSIDSGKQSTRAEHDESVKSQKSDTNKSAPIEDPIKSASNSVKTTQPADDLKRKLSGQTVNGGEPAMKKKPPTQRTILSFFPGNKEKK